MAKKFEPLKVDWRPGMTYEEEQKFFKGFVGELIDRENKRRDPNLIEIITKRSAADICHGGPEPWQPVYDDIMVSYLTARERRECEKKGFTREQTVVFAKGKVLDRLWEISHPLPAFGDFEKKTIKAEKSLTICANGGGASRV